jgi:hypothetical protein
MAVWYFWQAGQGVENGRTLLAVQGIFDGQHSLQLRRSEASALLNFRFLSWCCQQRMAVLRLTCV